MNEEQSSTDDNDSLQSCNNCRRDSELLQRFQMDEENKLIYKITNNETWQDTILHIDSVDSLSATQRFAIELNSNFDDIESIPETEITTGQPLCRICLENGIEPLVAPCQCDGSAKYIHETCLLTWFHKTRRKRCEICLSKVNIKSTGCKPMGKWRIPKGTYNFVFYFYIIYALATFCTSGIAFSVAITEKCITPTCIALYIACILSILSLVYCAGFTIYIKLFWKAAVTTNKNWKVYDRVSFKKSEQLIVRESGDARMLENIDEREGISSEEQEFLCSLETQSQPLSAVPDDSLINNNKVELQLKRLSYSSLSSSCV